MLKKLVLFALLSVQLPAYAQGGRSQWIDSVFSTLDRQEKVAQLFMMATSADATAEEIDKLEDLVKDGIGSLYITRGGPVGHARLVNKLQGLSERKLLVGTSAEWGLAQMMDSVVGFQKPMVAAAWTADSLTTVWARTIARQMKLLGFHINFAPNADDEIFPNDYLRYFGNNDAQIGKQAMAFVRAMQSEGILAVAKHLPTVPRGPGTGDSSLVLQLRRVDTTSLKPFQELIAGNIRGIATSNLPFSMQGKGIVPATVSQVFISEILKKRLKFNGLVFTDVRDLMSKAGKVRKGEAELLAFQSGADVLMNSANAPAGIKKIGKEVRRNKMMLTQLDASVKKILEAKYDVGLHHPQAINTDNLHQKLHNPEFLLNKVRLASAAVTIVQNTGTLIPFRTLEDVNFVSLSIGKDVDNEFDHYLKKYTAFKSFSIQTMSDTSMVRLSPNDVVVAGIFPQATLLESDLKPWIDKIAMSHSLVIAHFGNPFSLEKFSKATALIAAYTDQDQMPAACAQAIFGGIPALGKLPVAVGTWKAGTSITTSPLNRLSYTVPEAAGISSHALEKIKSIMEEAVSAKGAPGCYVLVAKDGKVVYEQSVGWLTYDKIQPVDERTIYDLASMTKVLATVPTIMFLHEKGLIDINKKASVYLPELRNTNKKDLTIIDILTHQSGLQPFIPIWPETMAGKNQYDPYYYSSTRSETYPFQVAPELFGSVHLKDSAWSWMLRTELMDKPPRTSYALRYSDLGPWILYKLAERLLNQPMNEFLQQNLYDPIGAATTGFLPLERFDPGMIAPTEIDTIFRKGLVTGTVHDERAAVLGGVAGHAGLFSGPGDVAKLGQMFLQKGSYGGQQYFKPATIELFTKKQFKPSRRGLGWDKPIQGDWSSPTSLSASPQTYGHTGFTGTCIWIDPEFNLVYIFLSNRVHPNRNSGFNGANIRTRIQEVIYRSIFTYCSDN